MTSPQEPSRWASPGASGEPEPAPQPGAPSGPPPGQWGAPSEPPPGQWGAPAGPPPGQWGAPQTPPPGQWGTPAGPPPGQWGAPPAAPPGYGPQPLPPYGQPWRPPALQPGIIPLRPLSLGEILDGGVRAIRANPAVMFGLSAAVVTLATLVSVALMYYLSGVLAGTFTDWTGSLDAELGQAAAGELDSTMSLVFASLAAQPVTSFATTILTGLLVVSVSRSVLGRKIAVPEVLRSPRVWWVVGFTLLATLAEIVVATALVLLIVALASNDSIGGAVAVGLVGALAIVVALAWFTVRTVLVTPALMLEGKAFWPTVARAWRLTRGSFWRLLGIGLLVLLLMYALQQVIGAPFAIIATFVGANSGEILSFGYLAVISIGQVISLTLTTTYTSAVVALLYIDVRMRREGLDVELGRAAAEDAAAAAAR